MPAALAAGVNSGTPTWAVGAAGAAVAPSREPPGLEASPPKLKPEPSGRPPEAAGAPPSPNPSVAGAPGPLAEKLRPPNMSLAGAGAGAAGARGTSLGVTKEKPEEAGAAAAGVVATGRAGPDTKEKPEATGAAGAAGTAASGVRKENPDAVDPRRPLSAAASSEGAAAPRVAPGKTGDV